jgi:ribonuclease HI
MGWDAVFRDHQGIFKLAAPEGMQGSPVPEQAEAVAIRNALRVAADRGFQDIILVSSCLSMVQQINSPTQGRSSAGILVSDIKVLMNGFLSCSVKHYGRRMNVAVHKLARSCEHLVFSHFFCNTGVHSRSTS